MAVRQYVGARYVPKFYENSQNPNDITWEANTAYEALTVVSYNYSTYTSKIAVPASVGNPADNPKYWAITGQYNSQVELYRQEAVEALNTANQTQENLNSAEKTINDNLNLLNNKRHYNIIMIGDSYGEQNDGSVTTFYWTYFMNALGLTDGETFHHSFQSGAGFGNGYYLTQLQNLGSSISDKTAITDIFVCGGWNDSDKSQTYGTDEAFISGLDNFSNYAKSNYPNARLSLAHIGWGDPQIKPEVYSQMPVSIVRYTHEASNRGWRVLSGCEWILHRYDNRMWQTDGAHPGQLGQGYLGQLLPSAFINGSVEVFYDNDEMAMVSGHTGWTIQGVTGNNVKERFYNGTWYYDFFGTNVYLECGGTQLSCTGDTFYATIGTATVLGKGKNMRNIKTVTCLIYDGTTFHLGTADICLSNNILMLAPHILKSDGSGTETELTTTYLFIPPFSFQIGALDC